MLLEEFDGMVPDNPTDLMKLPGVGKKSSDIGSEKKHAEKPVVADQQAGSKTTAGSAPDASAPAFVPANLQFPALPAVDASKFAGFDAANMNMQFAYPPFDAASMQQAAHAAAAAAPRARP